MAVRFSALCPCSAWRCFGGVADVENGGEDQGCGEAVAGAGEGVEDKVAGGVVGLV
jgi:hypothetical protein